LLETGLVAVAVGGGGGVPSGGEGFGAALLASLKLVSAEANVATEPPVMGETDWRLRSQGEAERGVVGWGWVRSCWESEQAPEGELFSMFRGTCVIAKIGWLENREFSYKVKL